MGPPRLSLPPEKQTCGATQTKTREDRTLTRRWMSNGIAIHSRKAVPLSTAGPERTVQKGHSPPLEWGHGQASSPLPGLGGRVQVPHSSWKIPQKACPFPSMCFFLFSFMFGERNVLMYMCSFALNSQPPPPTTHCLLLLHLVPSPHTQSPILIFPLYHPNRELSLKREKDRNILQNSR